MYVVAVKAKKKAEHLRRKDKFPKSLQVVVSTVQSMNHSLEQKSMIKQQTMAEVNLYNILLFSKGYGTIIQH